MRFVAPLPVRVFGRRGDGLTCCLKIGRKGEIYTYYVVGSSSLAVSNVELFASGGVADRAVARKLSTYRDLAGFNHRLWC